MVCVSVMRVTAGILLLCMASGAAALPVITLSAADGELVARVTGFDNNQSGWEVCPNDYSFSRYCSITGALRRCSGSGISWNLGYLASIRRAGIVTLSTLQQYNDMGLKTTRLPMSLSMPAAGTPMCLSVRASSGMSGDSSTFIPPPVRVGNMPVVPLSCRATKGATVSISGRPGTVATNTDTIDITCQGGQEQVVTMSMKLAGTDIITNGGTHSQVFGPEGTDLGNKAERVKLVGGVNTVSIRTETVLAETTVPGVYRGSGVIQLQYD